MNKYFKPQIMGKFQNPNHKFQTNSNDQILKFETSLYFGIWDLFEIWCLRFEILEEKEV